MLGHASFLDFGENYVIIFWMKGRYMEGLSSLILSRVDRQMSPIRGGHFFNRRARGKYIRKRVRKIL